MPTRPLFSLRLRPWPLSRQTGALRWRRLLVWLILLALAAGAAGWWWWSHRAASPAPTAGRPGANQAQPVSAGAVTRQDMRVLVDAIGTLAAHSTAVVRPQVGGKIKAILFKEGDVVRAGQVLAEIDARSYQAALDQAQGTLERDQALLRNAELDLKRYRDLLAQDSIPSQQVDTQQALVQQYRGTVRTDQGQVAQARLNLSYTRVTAPIAGRLGLRQVDLGNIVATTDAIVSITQVQPIEVVFPLPESSLPPVAARLATGARLPVELWSRDQSRQLGASELLSLDNAIDVTTGTIKGKALFANTDGQLFPNQFVNVRLQADVLPQALTVPSTAIQRGSVGTYVYAVREDGTVNVRPVRLGTTDNGRVVVQGQLEAGEQVVRDAAMRPRNGGGRHGGQGQGQGQHERGQRPDPASPGQPATTPASPSPAAPATGATR
ncbi:MAG: Multidrug resistance protein MdtA [Paracidovorax wautersii]|uniref:Multidrug resistance protein MdtA n=1 Tax=Paracidovorax wautersii TaxID=1177982 RepID=A0A7V8JQM7_9BURK|nr:MAG: Multidrug resistance protein MdtA [Paracidovorax wautersii]